MLLLLDSGMRLIAPFLILLGSLDLLILFIDLDAFSDFVNMLSLAFNDAPKSAENKHQLPWNLTDESLRGIVFNLRKRSALETIILKAIPSNFHPLRRSLLLLLLYSPLRMQLVIWAKRKR